MYAFLEFWYLDLCTAERSFRWVERRSRFFDSVGAERSWEEEPPAAHLSSFLSSQTCGLFRLRHERLFCLIPNILLEAAAPWLWPVDVIIFEHNGFWKAERKKTIGNTCNREMFPSDWLRNQVLFAWRFEEGKLQFISSSLIQQMTEDEFIPNFSKVITAVSRTQIT